MIEAQDAGESRAAELPVFRRRQSASFGEGVCISDRLCILDPPSLSLSALIARAIPSSAARETLISRSRTRKSGSLSRERLAGRLAADGGMFAPAGCAWNMRILPPENHSSLIFKAAMKASCGISTLPNWRIRFLPAFCFSKSLRLRVASPP